MFIKNISGNKCTSNIWTNIIVLSSMVVMDWLLIVANVNDTTRKKVGVSVLLVIADISVILLLR